MDISWIWLVMATAHGSYLSSRFSKAVDTWPHATQRPLVAPTSEILERK